MKIQPPGGPPPGLSPAEAVTPGAKPDSAPGAGFAQKLRETAGPGAPAAPQAVSGAMAAHLEAVSRDIAAGRIQTREQAIERLVDRVLDARFGHVLPAEALTQAKAAVAAQVVSDPNLSERIDRLLSSTQK